MADITCKRCGADAPAPVLVPPGKHQKYILENVCERCWEEWKKMSVKVINEYKLTPFLPQHKEVLEEQMRQFLELPKL